MVNPSASMPVFGPTLGIVRLPHAEGLPLPAYESAAAAGMDLRAALPEDRQVILLPGRRALVPTGFVMEIPEGFEGQVRPRSGLALRHGITCLNTPGTIDADYRGELQVLLINLGEEDFAVTRGMRIAQLIIAPVVRAVLEERRHPGETARGNGGFGSTGSV
ncbi:dUTP diphosphatase [Chelativorans sp. M5D2P16]|uniref:dUTP diphosphatase n=1 Tax=Chelativorans sp. M5D2P16 TaxID=3095678 RepID=UPI002ACA6A9A|nr:dUTP diphosphatase [Chelativorans sp. M5D2P16]MDZ5697249.1 dUTP diphosphatase [Chelativorans sp. M5D2P16]